MFHSAPLSILRLCKLKQNANCCCCLIKDRISISFDKYRNIGLKLAFRYNVRPQLKLSKLLEFWVELELMHTILDLNVSRKMAKRSCPFFKVFSFWVLTTSPLTLKWRDQWNDTCCPLAKLSENFSAAYIALCAIYCVDCPTWKVKQSIGPIRDLFWCSRPEMPPFFVSVMILHHDSYLKKILD